MRTLSIDRGADEIHGADEGLATIGDATNDGLYEPRTKAVLIHCTRCDVRKEVEVEVCV